MLSFAVASGLAAAIHTVHAAGGLCPSDNPATFTCPVGRKTLAVCGRGAGAVYRFGSGRAEVEALNPRFAFEGFSGGGESQIAFTRGDYTYVVYDKTERTNFGPSGRHDPRFTEGVLVRRGDRTLADRPCTASPREPTSDLYHAGEGAISGTYVEHLP